MTFLTTARLNHLSSHGYSKVRFRFSIPIIHDFLFASPEHFHGRAFLGDVGF